MSQKIFGAGLMWATPKTDSKGNALSNETPVMIGTLQEGSVEISFEQKFLYGSDSKFPKAVAQGKGSIKGKAKMGEIKGSIFANILFGQTITSGLQSVEFDTVGSSIPSVGLTITPTVPNSGVYLNDLGVIFKTGARPLKKVASTPAAGEYSVNQATGVYTFNTADANKVVFINYSYTATVVDAVKSTVVSELMGYTPSFELDLYMPFDGKSLILHLYKCVCPKLSLATKLDDFTLPEFDFEAFANESGNVMDYSLSE
jgi:hypothetical protein